MDLFFLQKLEKSASPILVHCSAGVGRTGTFIAVHKLYNDILKVFFGLHKLFNDILKVFIAVHKLFNDILKKVCIAVHKLYNM